MDNFNLQKFVKKSKNEFYTNLYEGKKKHSMEEEMHDDDHKVEEKMHDKDHKTVKENQSNSPKLLDFVEGDDRKTLSTYKMLGFNIELDDPANNQFVAEMDFKGYDWLSVLAVLEDCKREGVEPNMDWNGKNYSFAEAMKLADEKAAGDTIDDEGAGTKLEENHQSLDREVADRIEGLLNIPLKAKFLATGFDLINDLLEDDEFDVADIVSHLANELERMYYKASRPPMHGGLEEGKEEKEVIKEMTSVEFMELLPSVAGGVAALVGSSLAIPAFIEKAKAGKYGSKLQKLAKGIESAGGAAAKARNVAEQEGEEVEVEDTMEVPAEDIADIDMETPTEEPDSKEVFSQLVDAYEAAKELGDEKLTRQLANTITYFNKTIIFGDEE